MGLKWRGLYLGVGGGGGAYMLNKKSFKMSYGSVDQKTFLS